MKFNEYVNAYRRLRENKLGDSKQGGLTDEALFDLYFQQITVPALLNKKNSKAPRRELWCEHNGDIQEYLDGTFRCHQCGKHFESETQLLGEQGEEHV